MIEETPGNTDQVIESNGVKLYVDPISIRYLKGAEVDFVDNVAGGGFTIRNPNATSTCGCGQSFTVRRELTRDRGSCGRRPERILSVQDRNCHDPDAPQHDRTRSPPPAGQQALRASASSSSTSSSATRVTSARTISWS